MTNRELAAHFAALDPDSTAVISIVKMDTAEVDTQVFTPYADGLADGFDGDEPPAPGAPFIVQKW